MRRSLLLSTIAAVAAMAQNPLAFEVASVRPTPPGTVSLNGASLGLRMDGQQAHIGAFSLRDYIGMACKVRATQVSGPDWLNETRFDLRANVEGYYDVTVEVAPEDLRVMVIRAPTSNGVVLAPLALRLLDGATTPSLFDAIENLGLHLEARRISMDVIAVDQISKTASEN